MSAADAKPVAILYRWRLRPGAEARFAAAWTEATQALLGRGSLGSRLHRGDDGLWYAYAQWPSVAARAAAFAATPAATAGAAMRECVAEALPEVALAPVADFLQPLPATGLPG